MNDATLSRILGGVGSQTPEEYEMATSVTQRRNPSVLRSWTPVLALVAVAFLSFALPPYLGLDPEQARFPTRDNVSWHYPLMVTHILFGSVALLASCIQISPAIRSRWPVVHRWSGRVYVLGGIPLVGVPALLIAPLSHTGFVTQVSNSMWAVLWLGTTIMGYRMVRARRFAEHRQWMVRSFALIWAIVLNRLWIAPLMLLAAPSGMSEQTMLTAVAGTSSWLSWVVNLLIAEWWLTRRRPNSASRNPRAKRPGRADSPEPSAQSRTDQVGSREHHHDQALPTS